MDAFARLRQRLYVKRSGNAYEDTLESATVIGQALLGDAAAGSEIRDTFRAMALSRANDPEAIAKLIPRIGCNPYFDRYLADGLGRDPGLRSGAPMIAEFDPRVALNNPPDRRMSLGHPVAIVQCMFHGDPARSGRGNSGGIATLLQELGTAMADEAGGVVTLVQYNKRTAKYDFDEVEHVAPNHSIIRMPVQLDEETSLGFLRGRNELRRALTQVVVRFGLEDKVFHVRFLDDASLEVARMVPLLGGRLVATITPDPHRQICDADGEIRKFDTDSGLEILNKILIGDELIERSDGVLAIGRKTIQNVLLSYYPQLTDTRGRRMAGIDEGVRVSSDTGDLDLAELLTRAAPEHRLSPETVTRPSILSVGRLAAIKNQVALVEAWANGAWRNHNLVLIGGDLQNPSPEEETIMTRIRGVATSRPELEGRFCHLPGTANATIRQVQSAFAQRSHKHATDVYVCPSLKEEFGLSILEAMAAGMIVCAPLAGGAGNYIRHGENGFLIDTRTASTIASELSVTALAQDLSHDRAHVIRDAARNTVARDYSVETIAGEFARFYKGVQHA